MTAPSLRPQGVSRALGAAGLERATAETTSVRGYYRYTRGFVVQGGRQAWEHGLTQDRASTSVFVTARTMDHRDFASPDTRPHAVQVEDILSACEDALRAAGYLVRRGSRPADEYIEVYGAQGETRGIEGAGS